MNRFVYAIFSIPILFISIELGHRHFLKNIIFQLTSIVQKEKLFIILRELESIFYGSQNSLLFIAYNGSDCIRIQEATPITEMNPVSGRTLILNLCPRTLFDTWHTRDHQISLNMWKRDFLHKTSPRVVLCKLMTMAFVF